MKEGLKGLKQIITGIGGLVIGILFVMALMGAFDDEAEEIGNAEIFRQRKRKNLQIKKRKRKRMLLQTKSAQILMLCFQEPLIMMNIFIWDLSSQTRAE